MATHILFHTLKGVVQAAKAPESCAEVASDQLALSKLSDSDVQVVPLRDLLQRFAVEPGQSDENAQHIARLTVLITYFRYKSRYASDARQGDDLETFWCTVKAALLSPLYAEVRAVRSHQGFLSVPLCDLRKPNGDNEELWRVHLWLPNRPLPDPEFIIHSHKSHGQSWVLAGEGINGEYEVTPAPDMESATKAVYALVDLRTITHEQKSTTIVNTGKLVQVKPRGFHTHTRDMSYEVPVLAFHTSQVPLESVHATLFFFDASRGYSNDGGVSLGRKDLPRLEQDRNAGGFMATALATVISAVRIWELELERAFSYAMIGDLSSAKAAFEKMVTTWNPLQGVAPGMEISSPRNDLQGLNRYLETAKALVSWAGYILQGQKHAAQSDMTAAQQEFELARKGACLIQDAAVSKQCQAITATCQSV